MDVCLLNTTKENIRINENVRLCVVEIWIVEIAIRRDVHFNKICLICWEDFGLPLKQVLNTHFGVLYALAL
jgi:hypothetical protein